MIFFKNKKDPLEYVEILTELSKEARRKGLLALEAKAADIQDEFLKESVLRIVDAIEPDKLRSWFDQKMDYISARNDEERKLYDMGAALGPAFGILVRWSAWLICLKTWVLKVGPVHLAQTCR